MPANRRKSLAKPRAQAFQAQGGDCYYCHLPMWQANPEQFAARHGLTMGQVQALRCTGEHLVAHKDGGGAAQDNIVAACWYCNRRRHTRKADLSPDQFKNHVGKGMKRGAWHSEGLHRLKGRG
jgi:5-methylcytosine-specific restriction endonuclease McrA